MSASLPQPSSLPPFDAGNPPGQTVSAHSPAPTVSAPLPGRSLSAPLTGRAISAPLTGQAISAPLTGQAISAPLTGRRIDAPVFAALDLGTNNCRLLVGAPAGDGFRVLDSYSRIVRLGEGLHDTGRLSASAMARTLDALHVCAARLARRRIRSVRAIATEACRRAANGREFLDQVRRETGLEIDVISAREEAELALESCTPLLAELTVAGRFRRALLFDIGGGSTELAWVRLADPGRAAPVPELIGYLSLPVGVITLAEQCHGRGFDPAEYCAMVAEVASRLVAFERTHCITREIQSGGVGMLGTSGTVTTLAGVAMGLERYSRALIDGAVLSRGQADAALAAVLAMGRDGMAQHPCIGLERSEFVLPGCAIFQAIRTLWPVTEVKVADRGLREGMLLRMIRGERQRGSRHVQARGPHTGRGPRPPGRLPPACAAPPLPLA